MAGNGTCGFSGDGGPALEAQFACHGLSNLVIDSSGNIVVSDYGNWRIRRITTDGIIETIGGGGIANFSGSNAMPAASLRLVQPRALTLDPSGYLLVASPGLFRVLKIYPVTDPDLQQMLYIKAVAGGGFSNADNVEATSILLNPPNGVVRDAEGNIYFMENDNVGGINYSSLRKVDVDGTITTIASLMETGQGGAHDLAMDRNGNFYFPSSKLIASEWKGFIWKLTPQGTKSLFADIGAAGIVVDDKDNLYVADVSKNRIFKIAPDKTISTVAGKEGPRGFSGDGGPPTEAQLNSPMDVALDVGGNLYIADVGNYRIRKVACPQLKIKYKGLFKKGPGFKLGK